MQDVARRAEAGPGGTAVADHSGYHWNCTEGVRGRGAGGRTHQQDTRREHTGAGIEAGTAEDIAGEAQAEANGAARFAERRAAARAAEEGNAVEDYGSQAADVLVHTLEAWSADDDAGDDAHVSAAEDQGKGIRRAAEGQQVALALGAADSSRRQLGSRATTWSSGRFSRTSC